MRTLEKTIERVHLPSREEFHRRYTAELEHKEEELKPVTDFIRKGTVTLLYATSDDEHNNAAVLRDFLIQRIFD